MGSKLENYEAFILEELAKGRSYATIATALEKMGMKTSAQNIHAWVVRRASKVKARQHLLNPGLSPQQDAPGQEEQAVDLAEAAAAAAPKPAQGSAPPAGTSPMPTPVRSASITKQEPSEVQKKFDELAQQAANPSPLGWKK